MFGTTMLVRNLLLLCSVLLLTLILLALGHDKAQTIIDQITQAFERGGGPPPGGFNFQFPAQPAPFGQPGFGGPPPGFREYFCITNILF